MGHELTGRVFPQLSLSFLLGRLTQHYVDFGTITRLADIGNLTAQGMIPEAAVQLRQGTVTSVLYLVYFGIGLFV